MEELVDSIAHKIIAREIKSVQHSIDNPPSIGLLNAKLTLAQAEQNKAMVKFNATNPSDKKRLNPPRYVTWANHCVKFEQKQIDELDATIKAARKVVARYAWLQLNTQYVDNKIAEEFDYDDYDDPPLPGEPGGRWVG